MNYTVRSHTESFETNSLEEATSVMESMAIEFGYASIIDNNTDEIVKSFEV